jgi:hypothetical protein
MILTSWQGFFCVLGAHKADIQLGRHPQPLAFDMVASRGSQVDKDRRPDLLDHIAFNCVLCTIRRYRLKCTILYGTV